MSGTWNGSLIESILCHGSRLSQLGEFFVHKLYNPENLKKWLNGISVYAFNNLKLSKLCLQKLNGF
jgi:hypothetical protein